MADKVYDLPSVDFALGVLENDAGSSSGLSDAPSDAEESDFERFSDADSNDASPRFRGSQYSTPRRKRSFATFEDDPFVSDDENPHLRPSKGARNTPATKVLTPLETAPAEVWSASLICHRSHC